MYVIIVYDVSIERVNRVRQFLRQYLKWVQNSVFEGELTDAELLDVKSTLKSVVSKNDSVIIYTLRTEKEVRREIVGSEKSSLDVVI